MLRDEARFGSAELELAYLAVTAIFAGFASANLESAEDFARRRELHEL